MNKAVVVLSGGQDSTTCLLWAKEEFDEVETVTFYYGQRNDTEIDRAKSIAKDVGVKNTLIDASFLNSITNNAMTSKEIDIEEGEIPNTFVPGRNHLFLSIVAAYAHEVDARHIVTGVSQTDFSGYPDCRNNFIKSLNVTLNLAMEYEFEIHTPLMWLDKSEVWEMADNYGKLEYIRENTVTCYNGIIGDGCGECPSCELRRQGLEKYLEKWGNEL